MAATSRDFLKAARQRLATAEFLLRHSYNLDAIYLAGYAVECSLKAVILEVTPPHERTAAAERITVGKSMHDAEVLQGYLRRLDRPLPMDLARKLRRMKWSTDLRYETTRKPSGEARGFLKITAAVCRWAEVQMP